jgi:DNA recombination protein RmuC
VPSEAIYADLAEHFSDLVQRAHRARIVICAPNMLMLAVQTMQAILKDVQMREQAHLIQREVAVLMDDMSRFRDRVLDLQRHFGQANADIDKILTSSEKITKRGQKIESLDFEDEAKAELAKKNAATLAQTRPAPQPAPQAQLAPRPRSEGPRIIRQPDLLAGE